MNIALIVAAGEGKRMKEKTPKLLLPVHGKPILYYTLTAFYDHPDIDRIVVVANKRIKKSVEKLIKLFFPGNKKNIKLVLGSASRPESVLNGLTFIKRYLKPKQNDIICIHNGSNPLVTFDEIKNCIKKAKTKGACIVGHSVKDTLKEIKRKKIIKTHNREKFIKAQTPQVFTFRVLKNALQKVGDEYLNMTDEASLVEKAGFHVAHIPASEENFKITTQIDYKRLRHILGDLPKDFLVGIGQDSHTYSKKKGLILGGLKFADEYKLEANSDGDAMLHALCNACLQATGQKSLGAFADDWCMKKKIKDSRIYLEKVLKKVAKKKYALNNAGFMIEAKTPNIDEISPRIKNNLSLLTGLPVQRIGITATSGEKLTSFGKGKGIQCFCIVSLKKL